MNRGFRQAACHPTGKSDTTLSLAQIPQERRRKGILQRLTLNYHDR
jgi:hypothetical protein